eukprot:scaffold1245_cov252-Pinguiococcus_pyrenoidosus.AAC.16
MEAISVISSEGAPAEAGACLFVARTSRPKCRCFALRFCRPWLQPYPSLHCEHVPDRPRQSLSVETTEGRQVLKLVPRHGKAAFIPDLLVEDAVGDESLLRMMILKVRGPHDGIFHDLCCMARIRFLEATAAEKPGRATPSGRALRLLLHLDAKVFQQLVDVALQHAFGGEDQHRSAVFNVLRETLQFRLAVAK